MRVNQLQGFVVCCPPLHLVNAGKQHPQCQFFRFFPQLLSSPALLGLIPSGSSSSLVVSQVLNASQPRPVDVRALKSRVPHKQGALCTQSSCRKPAVMRCARVKCLSHCIEEGGCAFHSTSSSNLLPKTSAPPLAGASFIPESEQGAAASYEESVQPQVDGDGFGYQDCLEAIKESLAEG